MNNEDDITMPINDPYNRSGGDNETNFQADIEYFKNKLEKAEKEQNKEEVSRCIRQIELLEDALISYRLNGEPVRKTFKIDVGNLPKGRAEEFIKDMMTRYRERNLQNPPSNEPNA